jgi:hypothetical protein
MASLVPTSRSTKEPKFFAAIFVMIGVNEAGAG